MKTIKLKGHILEMYDGVDNMPAANYINHSRLTMLDAGIGSDLDAVTRHWQSLARFFEKGDKAGFNTTMANYYQTLSFIISNTSPEMMSFVSLIKSIDGKEVEDYSDESAKAIIEKLSNGGLTVGIVRRFLDFVKKKVESELEAYKLNGSMSIETSMYYQNLKKRTIVVLAGVQGKVKDYQKEVAEIDEMIFSMMKPERYAEKEGALIINFDKNCNALTTHLNIQEPERLPVRRFLGAMQDLKEYLKPSKRQLNGSHGKNI